MSGFAPRWPGEKGCRLVFSVLARCTGEGDQSDAHPLPTPSMRVFFLFSGSICLPFGEKKVPVLMLLHKGRAVGLPYWLPSSSVFVCVCVGESLERGMRPWHSYTGHYSDTWKGRRRRRRQGGILTRLKHINHPLDLLLGWNRSPPSCKRHSKASPPRTPPRRVTPTLRPAWRPPRWHTQHCCADWRWDDGKQNKKIQNIPQGSHVVAMLKCSEWGQRWTDSLTSTW